MAFQTVYVCQLSVATTTSSFDEAVGLPESDPLQLVAGGICQRRAVHVK